MPDNLEIEETLNTSNTVYITLPKTSNMTITPKDYCDKEDCPFYKHSNFFDFESEHLNINIIPPCLLCKHRKELDIPREILKAKLND